MQAETEKGGLINPRLTRLTIFAIALAAVMALPLPALAGGNGFGNEADLQLCKIDNAEDELCTGSGDSAGPDPVIAGNTLVYEMEVVNNGPYDAEGVVLEDILPAEVDNVVFLEVPEGAVCVAGTPGDPFDPLTCNLGEIEYGESRIVRIQVRVRPDAVTDPVTDEFIMHNDARVYSTITFDPDNSNDLAGTDTTVQAEADMQVQKFAVGTPRAGGLMHYEFQIKNFGPSVARDVTLRDFLPDELEFIDSFIDTEGGTGSVPLPCDLTEGSNALFCPIGDVPPTNGVPIFVFVNVRIRSDVPNNTIVTNNADILSDTPDPETANNTDEAPAEVLTTADLSIAKSSDVQIAQPGEQVTYTITVTNNGPSDAQNVMVTDILPADVTYLIDTDSCVEAPAGTLTCSLGNMTASESVQFDVVVEVNGDATPGTAITNVATVSSETGLGDANPDNDTATADTLIASNVADLCITKTAVGEDQVTGQPGLIFDIANPAAFPEAPNYTTNATAATAGRRIAYEINVENKGPSPATNVVVNDRLPAGVTIVPGTLSAEIFDAGAAMIGTGNCSTGTPGNPLDEMDCGLGTLDVGYSAVIAFEVYIDTSVAAGTVLENDVSVSSDNPDGDNTSNQAFTQTIVNAWADMEITKLSVGENVTGYDIDLRRDILEDLPGEVTAGLNLRYEITVQNNGASDAQNVQILDLLPGQSSTGLDHDPLVFLSTDGADCQPMTEQQELGVFGPGGGQFGQVIWCNVGTVPAGARRTLHIFTAVDSSVPDGTTLTNGAFVWWGPASPPAQPGAFLPFPFPQIPPELPTTDDPFLDDNFADTDTQVNAVADVSIQKVDIPAAPELDQPFEPDHAIAGREHRYLLTIGNDGPSVARDIAVQDFLDFKQFGILGETFVRCEPFDIDDFVACSEYVDGVVDIDLLLRQNEQVIPGDLNPGDEISFYLITKVSPGYVLDADDFIATNDSRITTTTTDFHTASNVDAHDTLIISEADLMVEKTDDLDGADPTPGGTVTYEITVTNLGPSDAAEVLLTDHLPAEGFVLDPTQINVFIDGNPAAECLDELDTPGGDVCFVDDNGRIELVLGNDLNCAGVNEIGRLSVGNSTVVTVEVLVGDEDLSGLFVNEAWVESRGNDDAWPPAPDLLPGIGGGPRTPTPDPDLTNNHAEVRHVLDDVADLRITKFGKPDGEVQAGEVLTYTVIVDNLGPDAATSVEVVDLMQSDGSFDVLSVESDRAMTCSSDPAADAGNPLVVPPDTGEVAGVSERYQLDCALDDPLEPLEADGPPNTGRWIITLRVRANEQQDINNVADVLTTVIDPNPANNHAEVEHAFNEVADLQIEKVAEPDTVFPNEFLNYILTVTNNGPSAVDNIVVSDIVPAEFQIAAVSSSQGVCLIGTPGDAFDPTTCLIGSLAAGDSATMTINVLVPPDEVEATFLNQATVVGEQFDPNNANNLSIATVSVVLPPPPPPQPAVCGCGAGSAVPMLATIFAMVSLRRRTRRRRR